MVVTFCHVYVPGNIHCYAPRIVQLPLSAPKAAPFGQEVPRGIEHLDVRVVPIQPNGINVAQTIHSHADGIPIRSSRGTRNELPCRIKFLNAVVSGVRDVDISGSVRCYS